MVDNTVNNMCWDVEDDDEEAFASQNIPQERDVASSSSNSRLPLELKMDRTPSFLNLFGKKLKGKSKTQTNDHSASEPVKAGNFHATSIRIGKWQRNSRRTGDITTKIYYAKHKLVWEVLEGTTKCKIETYWSDISAIRAVTGEDQAGTLEIELNQPPSYYREVDSKPRKHTLWQKSGDFTGGEAPVQRIHTVHFKPGVLDKNYEKLLQRNRRLFDLSLKPFPSHKSPYFENSRSPALSLNRASGSSYNQGLQTPYQTLTIPSNPSFPVANFPCTNEGGNMNDNTHQPQSQPQPSYNNQIYDQNPQYQDDYQPQNAVLNDINNYLPSMGSLQEPADAINPGYNYANYSTTGYQHPHAAEQMMPPQQSLDTNVEEPQRYTYQGCSSHVPDYYIPWE